MPSDFDKLFDETKTYVNRLENELLKKHLDNPLASPQDFDLDVKAFCVLCHAAFEEYIETTALKVMHAAVDGFILKHKISETLVCLLHFKSTGKGYLEKLTDQVEADRIFDYIRKQLEEIKRQFSNEIAMQNHGTSVKYARQLLMPVAIDLPDDATLLNSLNSLAAERHLYAHKFLDKGSVRKSIEPEKAKTMVDDCIKIWDDLRDKANKAIA
jgi:hypothetical protein